MWVILDFILLSQPTLMGIFELFLVKNCMRIVFALNQLLIFGNSPFMSSIKLVGLVS